MNEPSLVERLRLTGGSDGALMRKAADEVERLERRLYDAREEQATLRSERDQARRIACNALASAVLTGDPFWGRHVAKSLNWDCFGNDERRTDQA